jgi:hypothetical protein
MDRTTAIGCIATEAFGHLAYWAADDGDVYEAFAVLGIPREEVDAAWSAYEPR